MLVCMRTVVAVAAAAIAALASACTPARADSKPPPDPRAALEPLATSLITRDYCVGITIGLISPNAPPRVLAWGETAKGNGKLPDGNTVFEIGSVTKVFTSLLLAEAVIDKQLTLDTPVASLFAGHPKLPAGKRPITLLDLATHTSGLPRMPSNLHPADDGNPYVDYTTEQLFTYLAGATLDREPGARYEYSNLGVALLGQALAQRSKTDWPSLVTAQVIRPLAMTSTMVTLTPDAKARLAQPYDADGDPAKQWDLPTFAGAGALRSTVNDLLVFLRAELAAARDPRSRLAQAMALSQKPQRNLDADPSKGKIGLAWHIEPDGTLWHNGATGGYHSFVAFDPRRKLAVVVLANGAASRIDDLGNAAVNAVAGEPVPPSFNLPPPDTAVDDKILESYVGKYPLNPAFLLAITHINHKLYAQATGQPRIRLHATSNKDFVIHLVPASITFEVDAKGKVTGLVLHQGGQDLRAARN
jgi:serine-type D-Ala-D-Ala carboxypeptidase/endopeptidase